MTNRYETVDTLVAANGSTVARRISWGAIIAGTVMALMVQLLLSILGLGIGAGTIDPISEANPVAGIGSGAGIWFAVSLLLALFAGGYVAGRAAGIPRRQDGLLHGLLTWALTTLLTFYLLTTAIGGLIGGTARVFGQTLAATGRGIAAVAPQVSEAAGDAAATVNAQLPDGSEIDWSALQSQAEALLNQAGVDTSGISSAISETISSTQQVSETVNAVTDDPQSREELAALIGRITTNGGETFSDADRQELINFMVERGGRSEAEAEELVNNLEQTYQETRAQAQEAAQQAQAAGQEALANAEQSARETGQVVAENVSSTAIWAFIGLLIGAFAAALGGLIATPRDLLTMSR